MCDGEKIDGPFHKKELQKTNQTKFRIKNSNKKKVINYMLRGKFVIFHLIVG